MLNNWQLVYHGHKDEIWFKGALIPSFLPSLLHMYIHIYST